MFLEPSRARVPDRPRPPLLNTTTARIRVRRRAAPPAPAPVRRVEIDVVRVASLAAATALALTSRGHVVVLVVLLGFGAGRRASGLAAAGALGAAFLRWGSPSLGAIAGAQAVLGPAGWTGSRAAVASAWLGALALVLAAHPLDHDDVRVRVLSVAPFAIAAADLVAGPAPGGALGVRVIASLLALAAAALIRRWKPMPFAAEACAAIALVLAGLSR